MTASKDSILNKTATSIRLSLGATTANPYKMHPKTHVHNLSVGSFNSAHRVTRRKSLSNQSAGMLSSARDVSRAAFESGSYSSRKSGKSGSAHKSSFPASLPSGNLFRNAGRDAKVEHDNMDEPPLDPPPVGEPSSGKARSRRASDGFQLRKGESKSTTGGELKCETCGKGYKHSSCLTKHLWEHTPQWQLTSKLLISKHQQVQLLEAARVLLDMNNDGPMDSDNSSTSAASGSSDSQDSEMSSAETTPPPQLDDASSGFLSAARSEFDARKRLSTTSSAYSRSYQSSVFSESASSSRPYMSHHRQWSTDGRPTSVNSEEQDQAELAAAVGLLNCRVGTPKTNPVMLPADAPPVPPLPTRFLGQQADYLSGTNLTFSGVPQSYSSYIRGQKDVDMDVDQSADDDDLDHHRGGSDDDEGMFGRMEE